MKTDLFTRADQLQKDAYSIVSELQLEALLDNSIKLSVVGTRFKTQLMLT